MLNLVLCTIKLILKNVTKEADTEPYHKDDNELFTNIQSEIDTALFDNDV